VLHFSGPAHFRSYSDAILISPLYCSESLPDTFVVVVFMAPLLAAAAEVAHRCGMRRCAVHAAPLKILTAAVVIAHQWRWIHARTHARTHTHTHTHTLIHALFRRTPSTCWLHHIHAYFSNQFLLFRAIRQPNVNNRWTFRTIQHLPSAVSCNETAALPRLTLFLRNKWLYCRYVLMAYETAFVYLALWDKKGPRDIMYV